MSCGARCHGDGVTSVWARSGPGFMQENLLLVGPARDSNSRVPCRCAVLAARVAVGSGGGCRCSPATCRAGAPSGRRWTHGRPGIVRAGGGREIRRRKPRLHLRRGTERSAHGEVVGGVAWTWVCGPLSDAHECDKRGRGPEHGGRGPGDGADASGARVGRRGGLDAGLVRSGSWERVKPGPRSGARTGVKSRGCEVGPTFP